MKSSPYVVIIPLLIAGLVVGGVLVAKYAFPAKNERAMEVRVSPTPAGIPSLHVPTGKPQAGFGAIQPVSPVSDLRQSLQTTADEGLSEFDSLMSDASKL